MRGWLRKKEERERYVMETWGNGKRGEGERDQSEHRWPLRCITVLERERERERERE